MSRISNALKISLAGVTLFGALAVVPATTFAVAARTTTPFCTNLSGNVDKINAGIADKLSKLDVARDKRTADLAASRAKWDAELAANRTKWDAERAANFTKLEAKATTDAEKAAVQTYETSIKTAVATRRSANDDARTTFRSGVDAAIATRQTTVDDQITTLKSSVNSATSTAQDGCTADASNGPALRTALVASLKTARTTFQSERKDDTKVTAEVKALADTKHTAIAANDTTFKAATASARAALKTAFGGADV